MAPRRPILTVHYTGAGTWADLGDTPAEIRAIQAYAVQAGKSNEYNYVVGPDPDDVVYE
jgi:D-tyrosyl-tRNA(Tyr) deacylase